jgi:hypothetical protein
VLGPSRKDDEQMSKLKSGLVTFQENTCILIFACILHVSQTSPRYILGYISDTSGYMYRARGIHAGYMRDTYEIHVSAEVRGYIEDTCGIHERYIMRYMYLNCIQRGTYLQMYLVVS